MRKGVILRTVINNFTFDGAFDPGSGVFYDDASFRRYAEPRSRSQIHFRIWFSLAYIFRGDGALKTLGGRQSLKDYIDVRTGRR